MFGWMTVKRHDKIVGELVEDEAKTLRSMAVENEDLAETREASRRQRDSLNEQNIDLMRKVDNYRGGHIFGLATYRITLSFSYGSYNSFDCKVTFTPALVDITCTHSPSGKRFGWNNEGNPIPGDIDVIERLFEEMAFPGWHWQANKKPAAWFDNHDIVKIVEAVTKFNDELQQQVNMVLRAEQYNKIVRTPEPPPEPDAGQGKAPK